MNTNHTPPAWVPSLPASVKSSLSEVFSEVTLPQ